MLAGNLVVFPKFFSTYYPKFTRFWKSKLTRRHTESSTSWSNEHDSSTILQDYTRLNDKTHALTTFPSNVGRGARPVVSTTFSGYNPEHDCDDETHTHNGILKTVRVDQRVQYD